ncbi:MAG: energy transducer TonB [Acidobacteria bacterium]|nr:energy transducer TonB [Acidobacteriota bacterium]
MFLSLLKRGLPFTLTLLVGSGLGSIFSSTSPRTDIRSSVTTTTTRTHSCGARRTRVASESTPLIVTFEPNTRLTEAARRNMTVGVVELLVRFDADGKATVVDRLTILPDGLTEEAERAAERTTFRPATIGGKPYTVTEVRQFIFSLDRY